MVSSLNYPQMRIWSPEFAKVNKFFFKTKKKYKTDRKNEFAARHHI